MAEEPTPNEYIEGDISQLGIAAIQVHELFLELKRAGFTHREALELAGDVLSHAIVDRYSEEDIEEEDMDVVHYEITMPFEDLQESEEEPETESVSEEILPNDGESDTIEED